MAPWSGSDQDRVNPNPKPNPNLTLALASDAASLPVFHQGRPGQDEPSGVGEADGAHRPRLPQQQQGQGGFQDPQQRFR